MLGGPTKGFNRGARVTIMSALWHHTKREGVEAMITIRHVVCDRESYFVKDTATALDAAEYMADRRIGAVCVLDADDKLCGIFSERDLLNRVVVKKRDPSGVPIRDVMSEPRAVIDCADTPHEALERMERIGSRHL